MTARLANERQQEAFTRPGAGNERAMGSSFYRGETINFNPHRDEYDKPDFLENFILKGWLPPGPIIGKGTKVTAFGSCFAANITKHLSAIGFDLSRDRDPDIYISSMGEGLVNTYALLGQFEWALENKPQPENMWHGWKAEGYRYDEGIRLRTRKVFLDTEFFIVTLGLSEIWYDETTGGVFWRAVPVESFDASRHKFRVSTFAETKANLERIYALIREYVPNAKVLFTLSPIPLAATFRPVGCLTANSVSKAILRSALDEMLREHPDDLNKRLFYFPSYEIAQELFWRRFQRDSRHPSRGIVPSILKTFESVYCDNETTLADANAELQAVRQRNLQQLLQDVDDEPASETEQPKKGARKAERLARRAARKAGRTGAKAADEGDDS